MTFRLEFLLEILLREAKRDSTRMEFDRKGFDTKIGEFSFI